MTDLIDGGLAAWIEALPTDAEIVRIAVAAERERCAKIVEGRVLHERYREWPEFGSGNRSNDSEMVRLCDVLAAEIRRGAITAGDRDA